MKLATVKVEYTCGLTLTDRVALDDTTGEMLLPPRLVAVMAKMEESECSPAFSVRHEGYTLPVRGGPNGTYKAQMPANAPFGFRRFLHPIALPMKDQRQQNGRFMQTLSAASIVGAVGYAHSAVRWDIPTLLNTASLALLGVLLWYAGLLAMKGD
jgi:hypothetical protein